MEGENRAPRTVAKEPPERLDGALSQSLANYGLPRRFRASGHSELQTCVPCADGWRTAACLSQS